MVVIEKQNMYVLIIENEKNPELKRIPNRLETLRKIVGNEYIDVIKYKDVLIVFDEEAYKKLLPIKPAPPVTKYFIFPPLILDKILK